MEAIIYLEAPVLKSIKHWPEEDKPREKLYRKGASSLSNKELLGILIQSGNGKKSAVELADEILQLSQNKLAELAKQDIRFLLQVNGIGPAKAITIAAALELGRRRQCEGRLDKTTITNSREAANYLQPLLADQDHESFHALFLNHSSKVVHHRCISQGGMTATVVDPKIVFKEALLYKATKILVCHNHPSGSLKASLADINITKKLVQAGRLLDIEVIDHLIVSDHGYFSFKEDGLI